MGNVVSVITTRYFTEVVGIQCNATSSRKCHLANNCNPSMEKRLETIARNEWYGGKIKFHLVPTIANRLVSTKQQSAVGSSTSASHMENRHKFRMANATNRKQTNKTFKLDWIAMNSFSFYCGKFPFASRFRIFFNHVSFYFLLCTILRMENVCKKLNAFEQFSPNDNICVCVCMCIVHGFRWKFVHRLHVHCTVHVNAS